MIQPAAFTPPGSARLAPGGNLLLFCPDGAHRLFPHGGCGCNAPAQNASGGGADIYPAYLWLTTRTLNEQPEFKLAEVEGQLGYYQSNSLKMREKR